jgi:2-polyprenyl-3-methyl-5-hydroxy-6-metoxy-1,4-benzoquinol methylase
VESAELIAILREVRERVRAHNPETAAGTGIALPDLLPLVHSRDAALGKVAAIGSVNPRPGGLVNSIVQGWKKFVARVLDWHVREQVDFNRRMVACVDSAIEALTDTNRAMSQLAGRLEANEQVSMELKDIRNHWAEWRAEWERKLQQNEVQFLRSVADLQGHFQHRVNVLDSNYRETVRLQHTAFTAELNQNSAEIQQRLWADLERIRLEYERLIYSELRTIRQRAALQPPAKSENVPSVPVLAPVLAPELGFDYGRFAERFRGTEEYVKASQQFYRPYFTGKTNVLDIGCGRGEFLELAREIGATARGIDLSDESVAICRNKGLDAEKADLFEYLANLPEASLDGVFCSQVVEHIPAERLPEMIRLAASRSQRGGVIAIETPNPECLAIFATHFYLDPTHQRPVPHPLLAFYLEEFGVGNIEVRRLSPAVETMPSLASLPADFRETFFGGLDYAITGRKL